MTNTGSGCCRAVPAHISQQVAIKTLSMLNFMWPCSYSYLHSGKEFFNIYTPLCRLRATKSFALPGPQLQDEALLGRHAPPKDHPLFTQVHTAQFAVCVCVCCWSSSLILL